MRYYITGIDLVLIIVYVALILMIGYGFSQRMNNKNIRRYFMWGLALKVICGLGFGVVFIYYYGGGDTTLYYRGASTVYKAIFSGPAGINAIFDNSVLYAGNQATLLTQRFASILNLIGFNSYWSCTLLFAAVSFIGLWNLFLSFVRLFPHLHKHLAIVILFVPGVVFWSSGIMKDSICMLAIGLIVSSIQNIFLFNRRMVWSAFLVTAGFYLLINIKAYIALAMLLSIALYAILVLKTKIKNPTSRILVMPVAALLIVGGALFAMNQIGESLQRYSLENLAETAQSYQGYHERISYAGRGSAVRTGSGYTLGDINYNDPLSILGKLPLAINVTFFRPYLWEVKNPVMLLSALESFIILLFTLYVIRKTGIGNFFKHLVSNKEVLFCFSFALVFGFAVGFTSYNFGALVRYKAPCIPFFLITLVLINALPGKTKNLTAAKRFIQPVVQHTTPSQPL